MGEKRQKEEFPAIRKEHVGACLASPGLACVDTVAWARDSNPNSHLAHVYLLKNYVFAWSKN
jgi:hypothetical protein